MNLLKELQDRWPNATPDDLEELLWLTPYPFVSSERICAALDEMKRKWGDNVDDVVTGEMAEFDAEFSRIGKVSGND